MLIQSELSAQDFPGFLGYVGIEGTDENRITGGVVDKHEADETDAQQRGNCLQEATDYVAGHELNRSFDPPECSGGRDIYRCESASARKEQAVADWSDLLRGLTGRPRILPESVVPVYCASDQVSTLW